MFMKRPLVTLTILFSLGIFFGTKIVVSFLLLYFLAAMFLILGILVQRYRLTFNICVSFLIFLSGVILLKNSQNLPNCHISKYAPLVTTKSCIIKGFIADEPQGDNKFRSFKLKIEEIQFAGLNRNCCGEIMVYLRGGKDLSYGRELILSGNIEQPFHFNQRYREYLHRQGIWQLMRLKSEADIVRLNRNKGLKVRELALWMKAKIEGIIFRYVSGGAAGILNAMILGDKKNIPKFILDSMVKSGTIHISPRLYTKIPSVVL